MNRSTAVFSVLIASLLLFAGCGDDSGPNSSSDETTENQVEGPEDCEEEEWFQASDTSCQACPAADLSCDSLDLEASAIDASADTVEIQLNADLTQLTAATIRGNEIEEVCNAEGGAGGGGEVDCTVTETPYEVDGDLDVNLATFDVTPINEWSQSMEIEEIVLSDACGQEHTISISGSWNLDLEETEDALACQ